MIINSTRMRNIIILGCIILFHCQTYSQEEDIITYEGRILDTTDTRSFADRFTYAGELNLRGVASSGNKLPFWMYSNHRGRVYENSNGAAWGTFKINYDINGRDFFEIGSGIGYRNDFRENIYFDEWYTHYENHWMFTTVGKKQKKLLYNGLSASNENILWSVNAQPIPGIQLGTSRPVFISKTGLGFEASWNEYFLEEEGHYKNARLHHKSFHLLYRTQTGFQVKGGFQHFAHWGGHLEGGNYSPLTQNYRDAVTLKHPSQFHLSSFEIYLSKTFTNFRLELLYNHIATDRSGRRLSNTPDGRYGIFYESNEKNKLVNSIIYELYYTKHQSHTSFFGADDYFNHFVYKTGWAYEEKIIGAPFFTYDRDNKQVINNKFTTHHIGIGGQYSTVLNTYPYRLLLTYGRNDGVYERRYQPKQNVFYSMLEARVFQNFVDVNIQLATEFNTTASSIFGLGVHVSRKF